MLHAQISDSAFNRFQGARDPFHCCLVGAIDQVVQAFGIHLPLALIDAYREAFRLFAGALGAILAEDEAGGGDLGGVVEMVFAARGIEVGTANTDRSPITSSSSATASGDEMVLAGAVQPRVAATKTSATWPAPTEKARCVQRHSRLAR